MSFAALEKDTEETLPKSVNDFVETNKRALKLVLEKEVDQEAPDWQQYVLSLASDQNLTIRGIYDEFNRIHACAFVRSFENSPRPKALRLCKDISENIWPDKSRHGRQHGSLDIFLAQPDDHMELNQLLVLVEHLRHEFETERKFLESTTAPNSIATESEAEQPNVLEVFEGRVQRVDDTGMAYVVFRDRTGRKSIATIQEKDLAAKGISKDESFRCEIRKLRNGALTLTTVPIPRRKLSDEDYRTLDEELEKHLPDVILEKDDG